MLVDVTLKSAALTQDVGHIAALAISLHSMDHIYGDITLHGTVNFSLHLHCVYHQKTSTLMCLRFPCP